MFPIWANYDFGEVGNTRLRERSEESPEPSIHRLGLLGSGLAASRRPGMTIVKPSLRNQRWRIVAAHRNSALRGWRVYWASPGKPDKVRPPPGTSADARHDGSTARGKRRLIVRPRDRHHHRLRPGRHHRRDRRDHRRGPREYTGHQPIGDPRFL